MAPPVVTPTRAHGPWRLADHAALCSLNLVCAAGLLTCWIGAALRVHWHPQVRWLEGAIVAAVVAAAADSLWLLTAMKRIRERRIELRLRIEGLPITESRNVDLEAYVTAVRMTTYHLPSCVLVNGKRVRTASRVELERSHRGPCRMCL